MFLIWLVWADSEFCSHNHRHYQDSTGCHDKTPSESVNK